MEQYIMKGGNPLAGEVTISGAKNAALGILAAAIMTDEDVVMQAGINILDTAIVSGVPSTEYSDWNAVKLLYGDIFNEILNTKAVPGDDFLSGKQAELEALYITE